MDYKFHLERGSDSTFHHIVLCKYLVYNYKCTDSFTDLEYIVLNRIQHNFSSLDYTFHLEKGSDNTFTHSRALYIYLVRIQTIIIFIIIFVAKFELMSFNYVQNFELEKTFRVNNKGYYFLIAFSIQIFLIDRKSVV